LREYTGRYSERYEAMPPENAAHGTSYIAVRIGRVYDAVKGRVAVFRQPVQRLHAPRPTHLWVNEQWRGQSRYVGEAYSFDPGCTKISEEGGERGERCNVWELIERAPTPGESPDMQAEPAAPAKGEAEAAAVNLLTIRQAAEYARVDEKTIRAWLVSRDGDKPMLPNAIKAGRKVRIPRTDLDPWRKAAKATRPPKKTNRKRAARKPVKRKS